jgi:iron complex transport system permease protein
MRRAVMRRSVVVAMIAAPLALLYASLFVGRFAVAPADVARILWSNVYPITHDWPASVETIVRFPRAVLAMFVGAGLAAFGAAVALLLSRNALELQAVAFTFGLAGVFFTYLLARVYRTTPILMLVLSGVIVAAFFSALLSGVKYVADPESKLPAITYWLLGSLNGASTRSLAMALPPIIAGSAGLMFLRWQLNVLAMGDEEARSLGVRTEGLKAGIIVCTTLITAACVSVCGIVGWVGLVIPHLGRMLVGPDHRALLPMSFCIGAAYLLFIDDVARTATVGEIPLGILTALIGAPFFAYLLRKTRGTWQ